jgi:hypothetical protein
MNNSAESRKAIFRRLVDMYAAGDISALEEVIAPNYVGHASAVTETSRVSAKASCISTLYLSTIRIPSVSKTSWLTARKSPHA